MRERKYEALGNYHQNIDNPQPRITKHLSTDKDEKGRLSNKQATARSPVLCQRRNVVYLIAQESIGRVIRSAKHVREQSK